jgi:hypothetical protein
MDFKVSSSQFIVAGVSGFAGPFALDGLGEYAAMDLAAAIAFVRPRHGEARTVQVGPIAGRLHVAVVTFRGAVTRVISLRKANPREERWYAQATR